MHDLINDLAQIASSKLCIRLEESQRSDMLEKSRHLSYSIGKDGDFEKLTPLYKLEQLRTLLPTCNGLYINPLSKRVQHNILPRLRSLRVLSLSHYWIKELPNDLFIKLKLLRFLDLSETMIEKLPNSICVLYHLETLLLSSCAYLKELPLQMEKLINLRHLDISNTVHMNMPLHLSKLKSLQLLVGSKFLVGGRSGLRMEDLGEVHNLYGSLSVQNLQNVVNRTEAVKAKMREKNHVEKLSLRWSESRSVANSQTEIDILDELRPHKNVKEVRINGYRGTKFPNWLADPLFLKLVELSLSNCKVCDSLPALGQLPSLRFLYIGRMHGITEVTEEFYGSLSSKKPFNCLEKLAFEDMPEWKQWHALGIGEFPTLEKLSIANCPKLMGKLPENLCSLKELTISRCPELNLETPIQLSSLKWFEVGGSPKVGVLFDEAQLFTSQLEGMKKIEGLFISDCNSLTSLPFSILPSTLKRITISDCQRLKLEEPVGEMFLGDLQLVGCDSITELVSRACSLDVIRCHNLIRFLISTATERLHCNNLTKLKRLPQLPSSLKELHLWGCPEIESFPEGGLPFNLQLLVIKKCTKLVNGRKEWRLQRLPCLTELQIYHDGSDEEILAAGENWELPSSIQTLRIENLKTLSSQHLKSLTSLQCLSIHSLPQIQSLLEEGIHSSPSLQSLVISSCHQLQSVAPLPSSLSKLIIYACPNLKSFPSLPSSLSELSIRDCCNLKSFPPLPSSLSELTIIDCPNLKSPPVNGILSSLSKLSISKCPFLKPLLKFDKGKYWPEIAHISTIQIDEEYL
ncbi:putative disease resistance RPP13-like protein 1 [Solanum stenotomum]|uniref:putative disease resistance RPP13-like protein 1 n=1 Tax=Solanum stenotomum TaxID=172797 RepID=UPI0020D143C9|nr:putative disease resistance RPP13-like protein 1 [Solanum stenotomum]